MVDPSQKRTASVITVTPVRCMCLSRTSFNSLLKNVQTLLLQHAAMKNHNNIQKRSHGDTLRKTHPKKLISRLDEKGIPVKSLLDGLYKRLTRFMTDSLFCSLYFRLYRQLIIDPAKVIGLGDCIENIFQNSSSSRENIISEIRSSAINILQMDPSQRTISDHKLIISLMRQKNALKDKYCKDWVNYQFSDLCRKLLFIQVEPLQKVYNELL